MVSKQFTVEGIRIIKPLEIQEGQCYMHYKGNYYTVMGIAKHSETGEELVLYTSDTDLKPDKPIIWARPKSMFLEVLEDGMPRFRLKQARTTTEK